ncbi:MAG: phage holin family protein [Solirubrobacteraceae bacterium]
MSSQPGNGPDWEGRTLLDRSGDKIGTIDEIYLVEDTGRPEWALVKLGRLGRRATLVPLIGADAVADGVRAAVEKSAVGDAPRVEGDDDQISEQQVAAFYRHYGVDAASGNGHAATASDAASSSTAPANGSLVPAGEVVQGSADLRDEPVADLLKQVRDEAQKLVSQEIKLARAEMAGKVKDVGVGAGMFGGAGYLAHLTALGLMLCLIFALATFMAAWLAALIVTVVFAATAGVLALLGKKRLERVGSPVPEQTVESVKQTIQTVKEEAKWGLNQTR